MTNKQLKFTFSFFIVTIFVFVVVVQDCQSSEKAEDDAQDISFNCSIFHTDKNGQQKKALNFKKNMSLSSGDLL